MQWTQSLCIKASCHSRDKGIIISSPECGKCVLRVQAIKKAKAVTDRPSLIEIKTTIGWGSQNEGTEKVHGAPLSADDIKQLKVKLGLDPNESFQVPEETRKVRSSWRGAGRF